MQAIKLLRLLDYSYVGGIRYKVVEGSFSRFVNREKEKDWVILSGYNADKYTEKENQDRNYRLVDMLKHFLGGFIPLVGRWAQEVTPERWENLPEEEKTTTVDGKLGRWVDEGSLFFTKPPNMSTEDFHSIIMDALKEFEQDSGLVKDSDRMYFLKPNGEEIPTGSNLRLDVDIEKEIKKAYSKYKNRHNFVLESLTPTSFMSALMHENLLKRRVN